MSFSRSGGPVILACAFALAGTAASHAATMTYLLDLPAGQRLSYEVEFEVAYAGIVGFAAEWSAPRLLLFRLDRPGKTSLRRSGPSPQRIEFEVPEDELDPHSPWKLVVSGLPSRHAAEGRVAITVPDSPETLLEAVLDPPPPPAPEPDPWRVAVDVPRGLAPAGRRVHESTEHFRRLIVADPVDTYQWHDDMLRFLAERRDRTRGDAPVLERPTRTMLVRVIEAVRELERLSRAEIVPRAMASATDDMRNRAWIATRDPRFAPTEAMLDGILADFHRDHVPALKSQTWFSSFVTCIIVCERHFAERARRGFADRGHDELVAHEWPRILAAVDVFEALTGL